MGTDARSLAERVVLVVDDEEIVRDVAARILADAGFRVLKARSGAEVVTLLATLEGGVHLVLSDIRTPEMTGIELAALVAQKWPALPVLLMSGAGLPPDDYVGHFLGKPYTPDALLAAVSGLMPIQQH
jgi:CheY-like chemotaxis protein